ncbi:MAG: cobalamin-binding protein [Bryobacteraceae bacterium]|nr:cobalamin-binding protein [Bryobacteraceae bacterium]
MAPEVRLRIVPLVASATEIVHALGLGPYQVGRSHECDYPEQVHGLPVCTRPRFDVTGSSAEIDRLVRDTLRGAVSIYEVFDSVLEGLQPTHILTQSLCKVCAVTLEDVENAMAAGFSTHPRVVALEPDSLEDIWRDIRRVGEACGVADGGRGLVESLQQRMAEISLIARDGAAPAVACVEWVEPLMEAGHWTPQLIAMAGAAVTTFQSDPDILIVAPCGFDIGRTAREMYWLEQRTEWNDLRAVRRNQVFLADGNQYFNRPGPRVVETLRILAEICHPALFEPTMEGRGWRRYAEAASA